MITTNVNDLRGILRDVITGPRGVTLTGDLCLDYGEEDVITPDVPLHLHGVRLNQERYQIDKQEMVTMSVTVGLRYLANVHETDAQQAATDALRTLAGHADHLPVDFEWLDKSTEIVDDTEWREDRWVGIEVFPNAIPGTTLKFVEKSGGK